MEQGQLHNRSSLFTGDAGRGGSNIHRWGGERLSRRRSLYYGLSNQWSYLWA